MALTKELTEDKIEVVGPYKIIQIRTKTTIKEDGKTISSSLTRDSIAPGNVDSSNNWVDTDTSSRSTEVKGIANTVWPQSVKDAYKAKLIAEK